MARNVNDHSQVASKDHSQVASKDYSQIANEIAAKLASGEIQDLRYYSSVATRGTDYSQLTVGDIWDKFKGNAAYELNAWCDRVAGGLDEKVFKPISQGAEAVSQWGCRVAEGVGQWCKDTGEAVKSGAEDALNFGGAVLNGVGNVAKDGADAAWKAFAGAGRGIADSFNEGYNSARKAPKRDLPSVPSAGRSGRGGPSLDCP